MMSSTKRCRLCVKICQESKNLYDENGSGNSLYDITKNYFHPKIININLAKHLTGICLECWKHISDFQSFQSSVMLAQKYLEISEDVVHTTDDDDDSKSFKTTQLVIKNENSVQSYNLNSKSMKVSKPCENSPTSDSGQISLPKLEIMDIKYDNSNDDDDDSMSSQSEFISDTEQESLLYDAAAPANKTDNLEIASSNQDLNVVKFVKEFRRKYSEINIDELIAKHMPILECGQCSETFKTFSSFNDHYVQQHPNVDSYFTCFCSAKKWKMTDSKNSIKDHFLVHDDPDFFKCFICSNTYNYKRSLQRHISLQHTGGLKRGISMQTIKTDSGTKFACNERGIAIQTIKTDSGTKFACNECGKILSRYSIGHHIESMHNNKARKPFKCEVCEKSYKFPRSLREHETSHTMKDLYACAFCKQTFKRMMKVVQHRYEFHPLEEDTYFYHNIK